MRYFCLMLSICCQFNAAASCHEDSLRISNTDDRRSIFNVERTAQKVYGEVKKLSHVDTTYIMPQKYNFTVMIQNINTYEMYRISDNNGQHITFSSRPSVKVGPYFGWRWICLGYTIDFSHLSNGSKKQDFNLSLYSNKIGADLFSVKQATTSESATYVSTTSPMHNCSITFPSKALKEASKDSISTTSSTINDSLIPQPTVSPPCSDEAQAHSSQASDSPNTHSPSIGTNSTN